ncbi:MAG TPA: SRPBCC family protein [Enhygromyxa sp.]|nr:SRPBCC family protein [Enhygromyxa sp.]
MVFLISSFKELDAYTARRATESEYGGAAGVIDDEGRQRSATAAVTILRPIEQVYAFVRDFYNFPRFMAHLDSVEAHGDGRSHWRLRIVGGKIFEWDAEIIDERPGELVAWRSLPGGDPDGAPHCCPP